MISNEEEPRGHRELHKLQLMLRNLEEHNDLPSSPEKQNNIQESMDYHNKLKENDNDGNIHKIEGHNHMPNSDHPQGDKTDSPNDGGDNEYVLENDPDILNLEENFSMEDEESWLLESPVKSSKKPLAWLTQDVKTPELERIKGKLASKLDLISIQNRKEKLAQLLGKHNLNSHPDSAPGRLYQAESMCSVMSLDWEYDEDELYLAFSSPTRPSTASDYYQITEYDEIESKPAGYNRKGAYTDSPKWNSLTPRDMQSNGDFDELEPMTLDFESPPIRRSVQVAPGPVITRRGVSPGKKRSPDRLEHTDDLIVKPTSGIRPRRNKIEYQRSDSYESGSRRLSDRSDSSDSISSSRSSLASSEDFGGPKTTRGKTKVHRRLLPIASFFKNSIEEENGEDPSHSQFENANLYFELELQRKIANNNRMSLKPRSQHAAAGSQEDDSLVVKLPTSQNGPVIRRRGATPRSYSNDNIVTRRTTPNNYSMDTETIQAPVIKSGTPRPRTSAPIAKREMPKPRRYNQTPDILPRRGRSPERSSSPDVIPRPRRSNIVPRGQTSLSTKF